MKSNLKVLISLLVACYCLLLCSCNSANTSNLSNASLWNSIVSKLREEEQIYQDKKNSIQEWDITAKRQAKEKHESKCGKIIEPLVEKEVFVDTAFLQEYLQTKTTRDLYEDWDTLSWCLEVSDPYFIRLTCEIWDALQQYYRTEAVSISELYSNNKGTYYAEHPEEIPSDESKSVVKRTSIDDDGNYNYGSRTNDYRVETYGDFAVVHATEWDFGGGKLEWKDGQFYDVPDNWSAERKEKVYYKGKMILSGDTRTDTNEYMIIDGDLWENKYYPSFDNYLLSAYFI